MSGSLLIPLAYATVAIFLVAFLWRAVRIARLPVHLRWELAPVPHEKGRGRYGGSYFEEFEWWTKPREKSLVSEAVYMFKEIVLLKGVWEHNRALWRFSFPFHFGLYLLVGLDAVLLLGAVAALAGVGGMGILANVVRILAAAGYVLGGLGAVGLLISRLTVPRLKSFSTGAHFFNLLFLLAVFVTGIAALLAVPEFAAVMIVFAKAFLTANFAIHVPGILAAHVVLACLFVLYLPFTQMMHFLAKYFTYHEVRWDDRPMPENPRMEAEVKKLLSQPVTWAGPHLNADGKKNWVDIATEETPK